MLQQKLKLALLSIASLFLITQFSYAASTIPTTTQFSKAPVFVVTGGPGTGKTTLIEELKKLSYECHDEVAREIIKEQMDIEGPFVPWKDPAIFNALVLSRMVNNYKTKIPFATTKKAVFLDRGIPDIIGYSTYNKQAVPAFISNAARIYGFNKKVFIAPPWKEIYHPDKERKETYEQSVEIYNHLKKAYTDLGYEVLELPKAEVKERVRFVLDHVK